MTKFLHKIVNILKGVFIAVAIVIALHAFVSCTSKYQKGDSVKFQIDSTKCTVTAVKYMYIPFAEPEYQVRYKDALGTLHSDVVQEFEIVK